MSCKDDDSERFMRKLCDWLSTILILLFLAVLFGIVLWMGWIGWKSSNG